MTQSPLTARERTDHLADILRQSAEILQPKLSRVLGCGLDAGIGLSFHMQNGRFNHVRESDEDRLGILEGESSRFESTNNATIVRSVLKAAVDALRTRLDYSMSQGYCGVVMLAIDIQGGECRQITCGNDRTHKIVTMNGRAKFV